MLAALAARTVLHLTAGPFTPVPVVFLALACGLRIVGAARSGVRGGAVGEIATGRPAVSRGFAGSGPTTWLSEDEVRILTGHEAELRRMAQQAEELSDRLCLVAARRANADRG